MDVVDLKLRSAGRESRACDEAPVEDQEAEAPAGAAAPELWVAAAEAAPSPAPSVAPSVAPSGAPSGTPSGAPLLPFSAETSSANRPAIAMTTPEGTLISVNDVLLRMWGYATPGEVLGRPLGVLWQCPEETAALWQVLESEGRCDHQLEACRSDGTRFWVSFSASTVLGEEGERTRVLASFVDVTRQKQEEAALRRHVSELDAYAQMVAHELSNPLARVIGYAEMLRAEVDQFSHAELELYLQRILEAGFQADRTIKELLLLARLGHLEEPPVSPLDMDDTVRPVLERMEPQIDRYRPEIVLPESWPEVVGHTTLVEHVWENYLSNAFKYGGSPPHVVVGWDPVFTPDGAAARESIRFWVRDNGPGIPEEKWSQLFQPFTRLSPGAGGGQGLGLSIARTIVEKLGGQVGVESELGKGSTFWFTLPKCGGCSLDT